MANLPVRELCPLVFNVANYTVPRRFRETSLDSPGWKCYGRRRSRTATPPSELSLGAAGRGHETAGCDQTQRSIAGAIPGRLDRLHLFSVLPLGGERSETYFAFRRIDVRLRGE